MKKGLLAAFLILYATQAHASLDELIESVKQNNLPEVQRLLANGENVNAANEQGNTALHYAVALDNPEIVNALLAKGADLKAQNAKGWTPLLIAEKKDLPKVTPILQKAVQATSENAAAAVENTISQDEIANYKNLEARAKQEIINAREERNAIEAKNKALEQEIIRLKNEAAKAQSATKPAAQTAVKAAENKPATKPAAQAPAAKTPAAKAPVRPLADNSRASKLIPQINTENEAVVYCLNYLGQGENKNMIAAAGHYAASVGIKQARYNRIAELSNNFFATADTAALKKRSDECGKVITPADATRQNMIIRSMNRVIGY